MKANGEDKGGHSDNPTGPLQNDIEFAININDVPPHDLVWGREPVLEPAGMLSQEEKTAVSGPPGQKNNEKVAVSGSHGTIVSEVSNFIKRFVFLPEESLYLLVACWAIGTHLHKSVDFFGYLFAYSPEPQSGKTTLLDVLDLLVHNSSGVQHAPTEAVLFRTADGSTHLLDEVDSWKNSDDLKGVLNAGYKRGGFVTRCDKDNHFKAKPFKVFAPRALAGIGLAILPAATLDRTFAIAMTRQKKSEKRERVRLRTIGREASALKKKIEHWAKAHTNAVATVYEPGKFPYLENFSDRTIDIAEPLAAIIEVAYKNDSRLVQARETFVQSIAYTRKEQTASIKEHRVLKNLLEVATEDPLVGNAKELAAMCANSEEPIDENQIWQTLRKYGFKTKSKRKDGEHPVKRYELSRASLQELVDRWVPKSDDGTINDETKSGVTDGTL